MGKWTTTLLIGITAMTSLASASRGSPIEQPTARIIHPSPARNGSLNVAEAASGALLVRKGEIEKWNTKIWYDALDRKKRENAPKPVRTHQVVLTVGGRIPYDYAMWMRVHHCEQQETWHAGGYFGNGLPAGGNGLGFSLYAWRDAVHYAAERGVILPASGWDATPDQQMQAAQAMLDATGGGPDCL